MKSRAFFRSVIALAAGLFSAFNLLAQSALFMADRSFVKIIPDGLHARMLALNNFNGRIPGTLAALDPTNGAILKELTLNTNPTDMVTSKDGQSLYIINSGSSTISKVDLASFAVISEKSAFTLSSNNTARTMHLAVNADGLVYYTDGASAPKIYCMDFGAGTNLGKPYVPATPWYGTEGLIGTGGLALDRSGSVLYTWLKYAWNNGWANSCLENLTVGLDSSLAKITNGPPVGMDSMDTPILLDNAEQWVFSKKHKVAATNISVSVTTFSDSVYAISMDGSLAFGPTQVFNGETGAVITNLPFSATAQSLSIDQKKLFRYNGSTRYMVTYDISSIARVSGLASVINPTNGTITAQAPTNLVWSAVPSAVAYNVYLGTNQTEVASATPGSLLYVGQFKSSEIPISQPLETGLQYYWRIDPVGFTSTNTGVVWTFGVSQVTLAPTQIRVSGISGVNPTNATVSLTCPTPTAWTANVSGAPWMTITSTNGNTPATLTLAFNAVSLPPGTHTNTLDVTIGIQRVQIPVTVTLEPLYLTKMASDRQRPFIYALRPAKNSGETGLLLVINTSTGNIDKKFEIGPDPIDLTIHYDENRLYIASSGEGDIYAMDLESQNLLPALHLGVTNVVGINAVRAGRIFLETGQPYGYLPVLYAVDTTRQIIVTNTADFGNYDGGGWAYEIDPPRGVLYYSEYNSWKGSRVSKYQITDDSLVKIAEDSPYGYIYGSPLVLSPDGSTLFWGGYVFDTQLNEIVKLGELIGATTSDGGLALGYQRVFNTRNGQTLYTWPFSPSVMAVSGDNRKAFLYDSVSNSLVVVPMEQIAQTPGAVSKPSPSDAEVIDLPLARLSWSHDRFAVKYQVYLGTNASEVASASGTNSPYYVGMTTSNSISLSTLSLKGGTTYFWRVDSVGCFETTKGSNWSFTAFPWAVAPQTISLNSIAGLPILPRTLTLTSLLPSDWNVSVDFPWLSVSVADRTSPSTLTLNFNMTNLGAGRFTNRLTFTANDMTLQLPVIVELFDLNVSKLIADPNRNYIYGLHPGSGNSYDAFLLVINADSQVVERVIPIGINPTDMTIDQVEDRLYISNWRYNQTPVVDLKTHTLLPALALGTDVHKINAAINGHIITEGESQWININIFDTVTGNMVYQFPGSNHAGEGEGDPTGNFYYHIDGLNGGDIIHKYRIITNSSNPTNVTVTEVARGYCDYWRTRNFVLSADGSRLFAYDCILDSDLRQLGRLQSAVYACSQDGAIAFGDHQAFDTSAAVAICGLPFTTSVMALDRMDQSLWYFDPSTRQIDSLPLSVVRQPWILNQPTTNVVALIRSDISFYATPRGLGPLLCQWQFQGTNLIGQTDSMLFLNNIQPSQAGDYRVIITNPYGAVTSTVAHVTVVAPPSITQFSSATNVSAGQSLTLAVTAEGTSPLVYQWFFANSAIPKATNQTLVITNAQTANSGSYSVVITNAGGSVTSSNVFIQVTPAAPTIVTEPVSLVVSASSNAVFNLVAAGTQPMTYQWRFNETTLAGATSPQYSIVNAQSTNSGNYTVVVSNTLGAVTSAVATLSVTPIAPYFVSQPDGAVSLPTGTNLTLNGLARGSEPISYRWLHNNMEIPGASKASLILTNLGIADSGNYTLAASNHIGASISTAITVTVTGVPPTIVQQPVSTNVPSGSKVTLGCRASGSSPLLYQWYAQNDLLPGQTNSQTTVNPVTTNSSGSYFVVVSNAYGCATSAIASLTIYQPLAWANGLSNVVTTVGSTVILAPSASGNGPLEYLWSFNTRAIGETNSTLTLSNIQPGQSGFYSVTVRDSSTNLTSKARVSVLGISGAVVGWGDNSGRQAQPPSPIWDAVAVAGGDYHSVALRRDGTLAAWGFNNNSQTNVPTNGLRFVGIASGAFHSLAITENGSLMAWGGNDFGQTNVPATATNNVLSVAAGESHSLALLSSGSVLAWGDNTFGQTRVPVDLTNASAVAAGRNHSLALRSNGKIVGWGFNAFTQASPPADLTNAVAIAAGYLHSVALRTDGTVLAWGDNSFGQTSVPGNATNIVAIAAGDFFTLALRADGALIAWGDDSYREIDLPRSTAKTLSIAAGNYHGLAVVPLIDSRIQAQRTGAALLLEWKGTATLQSSASVSGPFEDVTTQGNSYTNSDLRAPSLFYRLKPQ